tara:strand:+ start:794 stop:1996 length:1203 start_codon:yes stop_codon:yes gene_type:complete
MLKIEQKINRKIQIIVGNLFVDDRVCRVFHFKTIEFLDEISKEVLKKKENLSFQDLAAFAFWIRKKNILKLSDHYVLKDRMVGYGLALHISPSNVPMNFAYSLVFGLLSGNNNILRLPSKKFIQTNILCNIIKKILKKKKYKTLSKKICIIKYKKSEEISSYFSKIADIRIIWGGDNTVSQFKKYETSVRCIDLTFPDRYSLSILGSDKLMKLTNQEFNRIVDRFYNDTYIMDQKGCSSPQAIVWQGTKKKQAKLKFYETLSKIASKRYDQSLAAVNEKISNLSIIAAKSKNNFKTQFANFNLVTIKPSKFDSEIEKIRSYNGTFVEMDLENFKDIKKIISKKCQTITYYGIENSKFKNTIINSGFLGIDRIVPVGRALDMSLIWDGKDLIHSLSRIVAH